MSIDDISPISRRAAALRRAERMAPFSEILAACGPPPGLRSGRHNVKSSTYPEAQRARREAHDLGAMPRFLNCKDAALAKVAAARNADCERSKARAIRLKDERTAINTFLRSL